LVGTAEPVIGESSAAAGDVISGVVTDQTGLLALSESGAGGSIRKASMYRHALRRVTRDRDEQTATNELRQTDAYEVRRNVAIARQTAEPLNRRPA
jgi:hypothetical protein